MPTRLELREACAEALNRLSSEELLEKFAISRVADVTGLDTIGVPVFTSTRALSQTLSIHAGKGLEAKFARAGAIAEAIEFEVAEHPFGDFKLATSLQLPEEDHLPVEDCFPIRASIVNEMTPIAWEEATNIQNGSVKLVPSELIWIITRLPEQAFMYFQVGSNGLASGASLEDAILSGLYEIVERDGWSLHTYMMENLGVLANRMPLVNLCPEIERIVQRLDEHELKLHLFDCTTDYQVPVFTAAILDLSGQGAGTFAGYGCHLNAESAALRAITEAIQGRACYISGARDDMLRRQFLLMKHLDQVKLNQMFNELECGSSISEYRKVEFPDTKSELRYLLKLLKGRGVSEVFVKDLGVHADCLHVVRVFSPQCEAHRFDYWKPGLRCLSYAQRKLEELKQEEKNAEQV
jgi:ribosomal protein S12 methylthiotransferase accessory factor